MHALAFEIALLLAILAAHEEKVLEFGSFPGERG